MRFSVFRLLFEPGRTPIAKGNSRHYLTAEAIFCCRVLFVAFGRTPSPALRSPRHSYIQRLVATFLYQMLLSLHKCEDEETSKTLLSVVLYVILFVLSMVF